MQLCDLDAVFDRLLYVPAYNSVEMRRQRPQVSERDLGGVVLSSLIDRLKP